MAQNVLDHLQLPGQMLTLLQHLRYTVRLLRKSPGFTVTAILILSFGIGVNTAIFSLIDAAILKPLPFPDPDRLVEVCTPFGQDMLRWPSYPDYVDLAGAQHSFESLSVTGVPQTLDLGERGEAKRVQVYFVSPSLARVSALPIKLGRWISESEDVPHGPLVAVLSEPFWRTHFQSDPNIVGKNIRLSGWSFQVIGVAPVQASACGPPIADVYAPTNGISTVVNWSLSERDNHIVQCLGRLKKGVTIAEAQAELEALHNNLIARYPDQDAGSSIRIVRLSDRVVIQYSQMIWLLGAAAGCLLLISCANVANLLYARAVERQQEMSIRSALGGSRTRLLIQSLLETAFLSFLGAAAGTVIAFLAVGIIKQLAPPDLYRLDEIGIYWRALLFVSATTIFVSLVSGLLPAWRLSKTDIPSMLKADGGRTNTVGRDRQKTQAFLVIAQVAVACVLLVGTGLLTRSFLAAQSVPLGFNPHGVLTAQLSLTSAKYAFDPARAKTFWDEVLTKVRLLPGLETAALDSDPPLKNGFDIMVPFTVDGQADPGAARRPILVWQMISPDFFRVLQIPLLQGRDFGTQDRIDTQKVVIVDQALTEKYWPGQNPVGKAIKLPDGDRYTIVGVAPRVQYLSPGDLDSGPLTYFSCDQTDRDDAVLLIRTKGDPMAIVPELRKIVASIDPDLALGRVCMYDEMIADKFVTRRLSVLMVSVFSGAALFLSAIGLYGILVYSVNQRTREIGIRIALGATSANILRLVTRRGVMMVGLGLIIGILTALVCSRFIENTLYQVSGYDPIALGLAVLALCITAAIACLLPGRRAARIDPIVALRQ
jgi:putative ABC transport system permease protein